VKLQVKLLKKAFRISLGADDNDVIWVDPGASSSDAAKEYAIENSIPVMRITAVRDRMRDGIKIGGDIIYRYQDEYKKLKQEWELNMHNIIKNGDSKSAIVYSDKSNHRVYWRVNGGFTHDIKSAKIFSIKEVWSVVKNQDLENMVGIMPISGDVTNLEKLVSDTDFDGLLKSEIKTDEKASRILEDIKRNINLLLKHIQDLNNC